MLFLKTKKAMNQDLVSMTVEQLAYQASVIHAFDKIATDHSYDTLSYDELYSQLLIVGEHIIHETRLSEDIERKRYQYQLHLDIRNSLLLALGAGTIASLILLKFR